MAGHASVVNWDLVIAAGLGALISSILTLKASFWVYAKLYGDAQMRLLATTIVALDHEIEYAKELGYHDLVKKLRERRREYAAQLDDLS